MVTSQSFVPNASGGQQWCLWIIRINIWDLNIFINDITKSLESRQEFSGNLDHRRLAGESQENQRTYRSVISGFLGSASLTLSFLTNWIHPTFRLRKCYPIPDTFDASNFIHEMTLFLRTQISVFGDHSAGIKLDFVSQHYLRTLLIGNACRQISWIGSRTWILVGGARAKCRCTLLGSFLDGNLLSGLQRREFFIIIVIIILPLSVYRNFWSFWEGTYTRSWTSLASLAVFLFFVPTALDSGGGAPLFRQRFLGAADLGGIVAQNKMSEANAIQD